MTANPSPEWLVPDWPAAARVRALSTLRYGGVSQAPYDSLNLGTHVGDASAAVSANRDLLRTAAQLPAEPCWLGQVHGIQVVELSAASSQALTPLQADAAISRSTGLICAVLTADCLPVLFAARDGSVVGAAHAGWRGLAEGVLETTIRAMRVPARDLIAWLGPAIGPAHFEVGAEVREEFVHGDVGDEVAFDVNSRGRFMANLWVLARRRLARAGIGAVFGGGWCTYANRERFFSHRRDAQTGRQATLIWLD